MDSRALQEWEETRRQGLRSYVLWQGGGYGSAAWAAGAVYLWGQLSLVEHIGLAVICVGGGALVGYIRWNRNEREYLSSTRGGDV